VVSGWSQEKLAGHLADRWKKKVTHQWLAYRMRFGRFCTFATTGCETPKLTIPADLTERKFRAYWDQTAGDKTFDGRQAHTYAAEKDEKRRFTEIMKQLKASNLSRPRKKVRAAIIEKIADKGWMNLEQMAERIGLLDSQPVPVKDVKSSLYNMVTTDRMPYRFEKCVTHAGERYRVLKVKGPLASKKQLRDLSHQLLPLIRDIVKEAKKHRVEISISHLCSLADQITKVLVSVFGESAIEGLNPGQGDAPGGPGHARQDKAIKESEDGMEISKV